MASIQRSAFKRPALHDDSTVRVPRLQKPGGWQICVNMFTEKIRLDVAPNDTIAEVKSKIRESCLSHSLCIRVAWVQDETQYPADQLRLGMQGNGLVLENDCHTLSDYNIKDQATLIQVPSTGHGHGPHGVCLRVNKQVDWEFEAYNHGCDLTCEWHLVDVGVSWIQRRAVIDLPGRPGIVPCLSTINEHQQLVTCCEQPFN